MEEFNTDFTWKKMKLHLKTILTHKKLFIAPDVECLLLD